MHDVERELIKVTGYKAQRKFDDRQDYLKSILNSVMKLTDDDFDSLSDDAATWANSAVEMHNSKNGGELPDFDEAEAVDDTEGDDDTEAEGSEDDEPEDDVEGTEDDAETEDEPSDEPDEEADEPEEKPTKKSKAKTKAAPPEKPAKAKEKPASAKLPKPPKKPKNEEDVVLDKWGCMEGSKNSQALNLFEKGATTKEVKDKIGGTYYNILGKMVEKGHKMSKDGAIITLTHKSSLTSGKAAVKKAKK